VAFNCGVSFGVCVVRLTKLNDNGSVAPSPDNTYVSDKAISVGVNPNIEAGDNITVRNGCGCKIASKKFPDTFNYFEFAFAQAALEPEMIAFLLGASTIEDGADVVGVAFPSALGCEDQAPKVAFEFWTEHQVGSGLDGTYPYFHWVFPSTTWQLGDNTFEAAAAQPTVNGFSETNQQWGAGPYGDGPPDDQDIREGAVWATDVEPPEATCAAGDVTPSS
jgi:hypothetical protein